MSRDFRRTIYIASNYPDIQTSISIYSICSHREQKFFERLCFLITLRPLMCVIFSGIAEPFRRMGEREIEYRVVSSSSKFVRLQHFYFLFFGKNCYGKDLLLEICFIILVCWFVRMKEWSVWIVAISIYTGTQTNINKTQIRNVYLPFGVCKLTWFILNAWWNVLGTWYTVAHTEMLVQFMVALGNTYMRWGEVSSSKKEPSRSIRWA